MINFSADMSVSDILSHNSKAKEVFEKFNIQKCLDCNISKYETIGQICVGHEISVDSFITELNSLS